MMMSHVAPLGNPPARCLASPAARRNRRRRRRPRTSATIHGHGDDRIGDRRAVGPAGRGRAGLPGPGPARTGRGRAGTRQPAHRPTRALLRCRGPHERGLRFTLPDDIRVVDLEAAIVDAAMPSATRRRPKPRSISRRFDVTMPSAPSCTPIRLRSSWPAWPTCRCCHVRSYDIPAARLAADGIPVYPRSVLIRDAHTRPRCWRSW